MYDGEKIYQLGGKRLKGKFHGSGCRFASSLAGHLFSGKALPQSFKLAKNIFYGSSNEIKKNIFFRKSSFLCNNFS
ncbi:MAG: bifunctional hydroxymethylpyrimidine kinase/phosphomethylpyrimidine kinase [Deltaproteobacteria bacterium]|nr:bifunctional hydroxymethylpyrimidine kinase/phosphomethylpyrimidine kinase [Deltaproteobacteria bacterium]